MHKYQKSKNNNFEKLRKVLDNISTKDTSSEDEKYLNSLRKRLGKSSKETIVYKKIVSKENSEKEIDSLKPKVTIYPRQEKKILEFSEVKEEKIEPELEKPYVEFTIPEKESSFEDEDVFEIKKVEITEPEFIEVKPKEIEKNEKEEIIEKIPPKEDELTEWEPIETGEEEIEEEKKLEITENYCNSCGVKLRENARFCPECGNEIVLDKEKSKEVEIEQVKEDETLPEFIPVKKADYDEEHDIIKEPVKIEEAAEIESPIKEEKEWIKDLYVARESKIEVFMDFESIDEDTAILLYDNGYSTIEALTTASLKDLTKIKGLKRKTAKKIKKEIKKKLKKKPVNIDEIIEKKVEDEISSYIAEKQENSIDFIPVDSKEIQEIKTTDDQILDIAKEEIIDREVKICVFKDFESIDDKTAVLLYDNGFTSFDSLKDATLKDLINIKGIKRRKAKDIKKEVDKIIEESLKVKPILIGETAKGIIAKEKVKNEDDICKIDENSSYTVELSSKSSKWKPVIEDEQKDNETIKEPSIPRENKIDFFKGLESVDEDTAVLLYDNGYTSEEALTNTSLKDLIKIKGINKKIVKKIKKEIKQKSEWKQLDIHEEEPEKEEIGDFEEKILKNEPETVITYDEDFEVEDIEDIPHIKEDKKEVFKGIDSIDKKIAKLLKENGINSVDILRNKTVKELTKIQGIKKKIAKQIKKEVMEIYKETKKIDESESKKTFTRKENPYINEEDYWESFDESKVSDSEIIEIEGFRYKDYTLYKKEIVNKSGKKRSVKFFSKAEPIKGEPIDLPRGYIVKENKKTGVPYLKKKD